MIINYIPFSKLNNIRDIVKSDKQKIAGIGVFDGIHIGHQKLIKNILTESKDSPYETTLITFYPPTRFLFNKDRFLLTTNIEKINIFKKFSIDRVIIFEFNEKFANISPEEFLKIIESIGLKKIFMGEDFKFGYKRKGDTVLIKNYLEKKSIHVKPVKVLTINGEKVSSTNIKKYILSGNIEKANNYLGYNFFMKGLWYKMGNKTLLVSHINKVRPPYGYYEVKIGESKIDGIVYIDNSGRLFINKNIMEKDNEEILINFLKKYNYKIEQNKEFTESNIYVKL